MLWWSGLRWHVPLPRPTPHDTLHTPNAQGPHLLAPTGSYLGGELAHEGNVFAGYHYDMNFLTLHGRSRFPGLFVVGELSNVGSV